MSEKVDNAVLLAKKNLDRKNRHFSVVQFLRSWRRLREQSAQAISKRVQTSCQDPEPGDEDDDKEKKERKEKKKQVLFA